MESEPKRMRSKLCPASETDSWDASGRNDAIWVLANTADLALRDHVAIIPIGCKRRKGVTRVTAGATARRLTGPDRDTSAAPYRMRPWHRRGIRGNPLL